MIIGRVRDLVKFGGRSLLLAENLVGACGVIPLPRFSHVGRVPDPHRWYNATIIGNWVKDYIIALVDETDYKVFIHEKVLNRADVKKVRVSDHVSVQMRPARPSDNHEYRATAAVLFAEPEPEPEPEIQPEEKFNALFAALTAAKENES
jgi:hypothetical protein